MKTIVKKLLLSSNMINIIILILFFKVQLGNLKFKLAMCLQSRYLNSRILLFVDCFVVVAIVNLMLNIQFPELEY
jgi:hypothetical protein